MVATANEEAMATLALNHLKGKTRQANLWHEPLSIPNAKLQCEPDISQLIKDEVDAALQRIKGRHGENFVVEYVRPFFDQSKLSGGESVTASLIHYFAWPAAEGFAKCTIQAQRSMK